MFPRLILEDVPLFVANHLHNLPPLSMDNFNMSRVIPDMDTIKLQVKILKGAQISFAAHVATCREKSRDINVAVSPTLHIPLGRHSPQPPTPTPPPLVAHTHIGDQLAVQDTDDQDQRTNTPREHRSIADNGGNDEDLRRLAIIQGRLSLISPHRSRDRRTNNDCNRDNRNNQHERNCHCNWPCLAWSPQ